MDTFIVNSSDAGKRLDRWLTGRYSDRSRSELQRWIRDGQVIVDGSVSKASIRLGEGQSVYVTVPEPAAEPVLEAEDIPLEIVYEDTDIVVVNKLSGMVVHPAPGHEHGTLVHAILHHCPDIQGIGGEMRPGIVHRLDKDTSGLIVIAKNDAALRNLQSQFKSRTVIKVYVALLEGRIEPERGRINVPLGRHPTERKRQAAFPANQSSDSARSRNAVTDYETAALYALPPGTAGGPAQFSLVNATLHTGRTHQLRVHFAWMKHPIVGDAIYGYRKQRLSVGRLFLHSYTLALDLPASGQRMEFVAPLPPELTSALDAIDPDSDSS